MSEEKEKKGFFGRLKAGLTKTRENIVKGIDSVFSGFSAIDEDFYEELEALIYNIEGNDNYGESFVSAVETAFQTILTNNEV